MNYLHNFNQRNNITGKRYFLFSFSVIHCNTTDSC